MFVANAPSRQSGHPYYPDLCNSVHISPLQAQNFPEVLDSKRLTIVETAFVDRFCYLCFIMVCVVLSCRFLQPCGHLLGKG